MYHGISRYYGDGIKRLVDASAGNPGREIVPFGPRPIPQSFESGSIYGKLDADLLASAPTGATVSIYAGTPGSETDTDEDWTDVYCPAAWIGTGKKIAGGSMVIAIEVQGGNKMIIVAPCPVNV